MLSQHPPSSLLIALQDCLVRTSCLFPSDLPLLHRLNHPNCAHYKTTRIISLLVTLDLPLLHHLKPPNRSHYKTVKTAHIIFLVVPLRFTPLHPPNCSHYKTSHVICLFLSLRLTPPPTSQPSQLQDYSHHLPCCLLTNYPFLHPPNYSHYRTTHIICLFVSLT